MHSDFRRKDVCDLFNLSAQILFLAVCYWPVVVLVGFIKHSVSAKRQYSEMHTFRVNYLRYAIGK